MEFFLNNVDHFVLETNHHECTSGRLRALVLRVHDYTSAWYLSVRLLLKNNCWDWVVFLGNYSRFPDEKLFPVEKVLRELFLSLKPPRKPPRPPRLPPSRSPLWRSPQFPPPRLPH